MQNAARAAEKNAPIEIFPLSLVWWIASVSSFVYVGGVTTGFKTASVGLAKCDQQNSFIFKLNKELAFHNRLLEIYRVNVFRHPLH